MNPQTQFVGDAPTFLGVFRTGDPRLNTVEAGVLEFPQAVFRGLIHDQRLVQAGGGT